MWSYVKLRRDRWGLKFGVKCPWGFIGAQEVMTSYTYAESISSVTETKTNRTTSDKLALVRDNQDDQLQLQDTYSDHSFLLLFELPRTADLQHVVVIMPF